MLYVISIINFNHRSHNIKLQTFVLYDSVLLSIFSPYMATKVDL